MLLVPRASGIEMLGCYSILFLLEEETSHNPFVEQNDESFLKCEMLILLTKFVSLWCYLNNSELKFDRFTVDIR